MSATIELVFEPVAQLWTLGRVVDGNAKALTREELEAHLASRADLVELAESRRQLLADVRTGLIVAGWHDDELVKRVKLAAEAPSTTEA